MTRAVDDFAQAHVMEGVPATRESGHAKRPDGVEPPRNCDPRIGPVSRSPIERYRVPCRTSGNEVPGLARYAWITPGERPSGDGLRGEQGGVGDHPDQAARRVSAERLNPNT